MKKMQYKGFKITEYANGTYRVILSDWSGHYEQLCKTFWEAAMWVFNMADNHDIGAEVNHRMCKVFSKKIIELEAV